MTGRSYLGGSGGRERSWMAAFSWVFAARVGAGGASFLCVVLIARSLGPARFSEFAILLALMRVAAEFAGPALDTTLVRFAARHIGFDGDPLHDQSLPYFRVMLWVKAVLALVLVAAGVLFAAPIGALLFEGEPGAAGVSIAAVPLAFLGAGCTLLWAYAQAYFQAHQQFTRYALFDMANAGARLVLVVVAVLAGYTSATCLLAAFVVSQGVLAVVIGVRLPLRALLTARLDTSGIGGRMFGFAKWVMAACCLTALGQRVDLFLLAFFHVDKETIGHYAPALQLVLLGDLVILTLFNVLLPKASRLRSASEVAGFLRRFRLPLVLLALGMLSALIVAEPVSRLVFGDAYAETGTLFAILFVGTAFAVACAPASTALYGLGRSNVIALLEGLRVAGLLLGGCYLIPEHGAEGMAWTVAVTKGTIGIAAYVLVQQEIRSGMALERERAETEKRSEERDGGGDASTV